jgi:hypothetical protein
MDSFLREAVEARKIVNGGSLDQAERSRLVMPRSKNLWDCCEVVAELFITKQIPC